MGTEIVKHVDTIKEMFALETAWCELPSAEEPNFTSTLDRIEDGYISSRYAILLLASVALLPSASIAFMTGFDSAESIAATFMTMVALPIGSIVAELSRENKKSLFGMLDTRILRRKKYRVLYEKEQQEYADSVKAYKKEHKKAEKAKKKLMLEAERISSEADGKMVFSNGKFSSVKEEKDQVKLSAREQELMGQFMKQIEVGS